MVRASRGVLGVQENLPLLLLRLSIELLLQRKCDTWTTGTISSDHDRRTIGILRGENGGQQSQFIDYTGIRYVSILYQRNK